MACDGVAQPLIVRGVALLRPMHACDSSCVSQFCLWRTQMLQCPLFNQLSTPVRNNLLFEYHAPESTANVSRTAEKLTTLLKGGCILGRLSILALFNGSPAGRVRETVTGQSLSRKALLQVC